MTGASTSTCILVPPGKAPMPLPDGLPMIAEAGFAMFELSRRNEDFAEHTDPHYPTVAELTELRHWSERMAEYAGTDE